MSRRVPYKHGIFPLKRLDLFVEQSVVRRETGEEHQLRRLISRVRIDPSSRRALYSCVLSCAYLFLIG